MDAQARANLIGMSVFFLIMIIIGVVVIKFVPGPPKQTRRYTPPRITRVEYIGSEYKPTKKAKRRFLAALLFLGTTEGLILGALEGETLHHRFRVYYDTGSVRNVECLDGSTEYYNLISRV